MKEKSLRLKSKRYKMLLGGFQKVSLIDYPGKLACAVFTIGCNFRCPFCHNRGLVVDEEIKKHPKISESKFFNFLKGKKGLLEGVCVTGGEPNIHKDLPNFIKKIKKMGFKVKLDTNGSAPEMLKSLIDKKLVDYVAMDIKAPLGLNFQFLISNFQLNSKSQTPKYEAATGVKVDLSKIKKSIEIIKNSGIDYEFRTTVVPGIHAKEDILEIAKEISPAKKYYLQNFRPEKTIDPKFAKIRPESDEWLLEIQKAIAPFFDVCLVR